MTFVPIHVENNWYNYTFYLGSKTGPKLEFPARHVIQWPDGSTQGVNVISKRITTPYSDHGHEYTATSDVPMIEIRHRAAKLILRLDKLPVKVQLPE